MNPVLILGITSIVAALGCYSAGFGILGFSATALMIVALALVWRHRRRVGEQLVPRALFLYVRLAYGCWVTAFVSGLVLAARRGGSGA